MDLRVNGACACVSQKGSTALHLAAYAGHRAVIKALLTHGAHLEAENKVCKRAGRAPLPAAAAGAMGGAALLGL